MNKAQYIEIGKKIKELRERLGVGTREFAKNIPGLQSSNLSEIERGERRPTVPMIIGICKKYHVGVEEIINLNRANVGGGVKSAKVRWVPVYSLNHAVDFYSGRLATEQTPIGYYPSTSEDTHALFISVEDDGIREFGVSKGDYLLIEPSAPVDGGHIVLALAKDSGCQQCDGRIRKFFKSDDGGIVLIGGGEATPCTLTKQEANRCRFFRATAVVKTL